VIGAHEVSRPRDNVLGGDFAVVHQRDLCLHLVESPWSKPHEGLLCEGIPSALSHFEVLRAALNNGADSEESEYLLAT